MSVLDLSDRLGVRNPNWKGGVIYSKGYRMIRMEGHPRAWKRGFYVYEHIAVMEAVLGRYLTKDENVDHINELKDDNRPENLRLLSPADHARRHKKGVEVVDKSNRVCHSCRARKTYVDRRGRPHWYLSKSNPLAVLCMRCYDKIKPSALGANGN